MAEGCGDAKMDPKRKDHHEDGCSEVNCSGGCLASIWSMNPENTTIPPAPSGPNPYENALHESGLSTNTSEYGGPGMICGAGPVAGSLAVVIWQRECSTSVARGRGLRGNSAGGGKGMSSGVRSSHCGSSVRSCPRRGITVSSRRRVSATQAYLQSLAGITTKGLSLERISPTA